MQSKSHSSDLLNAANKPLPKRVFCAVKHLPLILEKTDEGYKITNSSLGPLVSAYRLLAEDNKGLEFIWVGTLLDYVPPEDRAALAKRIREEFNSVVIFLDDKVRRQWLSFCKTVLWPLLNSQLVTNKFEPALWQAYKSCNEQFAEALSKAVTGAEDEVVWIHDYHLKTLPEKLRERGVTNRIGFFLHTPFPTSELYRILPVRGKLLQGILASDLIGFQTYHDCRHFLSACTRVLALDSQPKGVEWNGHMVAVDIFPAGIDPDVLEHTMEQPQVKKRVEELKKMFEGKKILMGRDRLDTIKGIPQKLLAFEDFLGRFPEWQGKAVLFQVCLPPREERKTSKSQTSAEGELQELHAQINELVGRINGRYSTADFTPIHYLNNKNLSLDEICALYMAADAGILTPLRDGMNLTCHEYVVCQKGNYGPLILSEFAGSAQSLGGAVLVNPWDIRGVASTIAEVFSMNETDKKLKHEYNFHYVKRNTALLWARTFLSELMKIEVSTTVPKIKFNDVCSAYSQAKKRLFLLDYDGTLTPIVKNPQDAKPSPRLLKALKDLTADKRNQVYIISGRGREFLEQCMAGLPVGLSCEHGLFFRHYESDQWEDLLSGMEFTWKDIVLPILEDYTERTPGSMIETKEVNLVWHYRNADSDFASFQAKELVVHLQNIASKLPIEVLIGKKVIEIRPQNVSKGATVRKIMSLEPDADFVLCMGDDKTDEDMFAAIQHHLQRSSSTDNVHSKDGDKDRGAGFFSCVVNRQDSQAKYFIRNQRQVVKLLQALGEGKTEVEDEGVDDDFDDKEGNASEHSKEKAAN
jgi:trehalose 6-phosphate synthase/phosphatase